MSFKVMSVILLALLTANEFVVASPLRSLEDTTLANSAAIGRRSLARSEFRVAKAESAGFSVFRQQAVAFREVRQNKVAPHTIPLYTEYTGSPSGRYIDLLVDREFRDNNSAINNLKDASHVAPIKIGDQSFLGLLDTGSADTWVLSNEFKCSSNPECNSLRAKGYKQSSTFKLMPEIKLDASYATFERLQGIFGKETVTLGGVTANVTIGIAQKGGWQGSVPGTIGMAFPGDTRAFDKDFNVDTATMLKNTPYDPVFTSMYKQGLVDPYFSVALNRQNEGPGALALGGLPATPIRYEDKFTSAKFEYLIFEDGSYGRAGNTNKEYSLYMIKPQGFSVAGRELKESVDAIVDTGSPITYVPEDVATAFNKAWTPAASRDQMSGQWSINCDAVPPPFAFIINGTKLFMSPEDMAVKGGVNNLPRVRAGKCLSTVQASGLLAAGVHIIGSPFLKSFVAVFDVGAAEMRFAKRIR
ncbi:acid protease [Microthyrium microscopicum]|uniref:Acid protease n=1 Tax=Microthyrium microscopicum TaxID=703497 RepID=A0A6A6TZ39_9PEZI|nr:acid protease [Microthyrium microscopicum]